MFTDIVGSTATADRRGDHIAEEIRRRHDEIVRACLSDFAGREIKTTGDGIFASFATAVDAVDAAACVQKQVSDHGIDVPDRAFDVRIGLHAGAPLPAEDGDLHGTAVNLAARICAEAGGRQVFASRTIVDLCEGESARLVFVPLGLRPLKGVSDPRELFEAPWEGWRAHAAWLKANGRGGLNVFSRDVPIEAIADLAAELADKPLNHTILSAFLEAQEKLNRLAARVPDRDRDAPESVHVERIHKMASQLGGELTRAFPRPIREAARPDTHVAPVPQDQVAERTAPLAEKIRKVLDLFDAVKEAASNRDEVRLKVVLVEIRLNLKELLGVISAGMVDVNWANMLRRSLQTLVNGVGGLRALIRSVANIAGSVVGEVESLLDQFKTFVSGFLPPEAVDDDAPRPLVMFRDRLADGSDGPQMVVIPAGRFRMGSPDGEGSKDEHPRHLVTIAAPFALGRYPVTQAEWAAVMGDNPSEFVGADRPVETVSWDAAREFIRRLGEATGQSYRLPSEAEWEYACRAGTDTAYHTGASITAAQARFGGGDGPAAVGAYPANGFGLHDMHGNVWEWVEDCYVGTYAQAPTDGSAVIGINACYRVSRGGSWGSLPGVLRSAYRYGYSPDDRRNLLGLRLARTLR
ncbi:MAG: SUMF1/EgtB/PvdO family nonheme iron enzyme [Magnetospirillum sp.]|nr:SUMF1/EgtB/PvdO family nonheme iron enzyme [Magnetospirillum sp.]